MILWVYYDRKKRNFPGGRKEIERRPVAGDDCRSPERFGNIQGHRSLADFRKTAGAA